MKDSRWNELMEGLDQHQIDPQVETWAKLEAQLDRSDRKPVVVRRMMPWFTVAAAASIAIVMWLTAEAPESTTQEVAPPASIAQETSKSQDQKVAEQFVETVQPVEVEALTQIIEPKVSPDMIIKREPVKLIAMHKTSVREIVNGSGHPRKFSNLMMPAYTEDVPDESDLALISVERIAVAGQKISDAWKMFKFEPSPMSWTEHISAKVKISLSPEQYRKLQEFTKVSTNVNR